MKALVGLLAACVVFLTFARSVLLRWSSLSAAAIVRLHITPCTAAITVILAMRIPATTRATSALAREATTGLCGGIGTTGGIMADGTGGAYAAGTVVAGMVLDGMAADGTAIINSEPWSKDRGPNVVLARGSLPPPARLPKSTIGLSLNF